DPVPADDAVPGAIMRPAAVHPGTIARPHHRPVLPWRLDRRATGQHSRRDGRRVAGRPVGRRRPRQRRDARRGRPGIGGGGDVKRGLGIAGVLFCWFGASAAAGEIADRFPDAAWEHVAPAAAGWSAEQLKSAEEWSGHIGSTAVIVIHHGAVVAEWGDTAAKTQLASVRKSLLSALIGIA